MDALNSILFYFCAAAAVGGALVAAVLPGAIARGYGLLAFALGAAGLLGALSAGFAAIVCLVGLAACALLLGGRRAPDAPEALEGMGFHHVAGGAAGLLLVALLYVGWRADFAQSTYPGGWFGAAAVGRLLFGRDTVPLEAVGGVLLAALVGAGWGLTAVGRRR